MKQTFEYRHSKLIVLLLPCLLLSCGALWQSKPDTPPPGPVELARTGQYKEAADGIEAMVNSGTTDAHAIEMLYYSWIRQGQYAKAKERFDAWAAAKPNVGGIRLAAARIDSLTGDPAGALANLDPIQNFPDVGTAAKLEKARVLEETGKRDDADQLYKTIIQGFQNGSIRSANDMLYVAQALRAMEYLHDADDLLKVATQRDPRNAEALIEWADLQAYGNNEPKAIESYQDALKVDSNLPVAHLGLSRLLALTDEEKSDKELAKALEVNPNFPDAHLAQAGGYIDSENFDKAKAEIAKALTVNPRALDALSLMASISYLQYKKDDFDRYVQQVLQADPQYSDLYYTLADTCVSVRFYKEAVDFARQALQLNPRNWKAASLLGINLLRIGEEKEGKDVLETAFKGDPFDTLVYNNLKLLDSFKNFDTFDSPHFHITLNKSESAVLRPYVTDLLEKAYNDLSAKYGFKPEPPITFEMFPDHADFAVRTLGLPGIDALGVTFGRVLVMDSPSARPPDEFNWGTTAWHEFTHVITLEMTDHKIPRWFSEGLSVFEERNANPGWGDHLTWEFLSAIKDKKFLPVANIRDGFMHPTYPDEILVSYYEASLIAEYIDQKFGFQAIRQMLLLYKDNRTTEQVFKEALNLSLPEFDTQFLKWEDDRTKDIDPKAVAQMLKDAQDDVAKGDTDKAVELFRRAIQIYPEFTEEGHNAYEPLADIYLKKGDKPDAIDVLKKFSLQSQTAFTSDMKLAGLLQESGDIDGARQVLEMAIYIRPLDIGEHEKLGSVLLAEKRYAPAEREFEALIALNAPDRAGAYFNLATANFGAGHKDDAKKNVLKCLEIAPTFEPAQELLLKIVSK